MPLAVLRTDLVTERADAEQMAESHVHVTSRCAATHVRPRRQVQCRPGFEASPGLVSMASPLEVKVAFFGALFAARTDIYATRWENARTGQKAGFPRSGMAGVKVSGMRCRDYLPLTAEVLAAHLSGQVRIGLYPLLDGDRCWWLAAEPGAVRQPLLDIDTDGSLAPLVLNLLVHPTEYSYPGDAEPSAPGSMAAIYQRLAADEAQGRRIPDRPGQDARLAAVLSRPSTMSRCKISACFGPGTGIQVASARSQSAMYDHACSGFSGLAAARGWVEILWKASRVAHGSPSLAGPFNASSSQSRAA
jgi:hypothetical protein